MKPSSAASRDEKKHLILHKTGVLSLNSGDYTPALEHNPTAGGVYHIRMGACSHANIAGNSSGTSSQPNVMNAQADALMTSSRADVLL